MKKAMIIAITICVVLSGGVFVFNTEGRNELQKNSYKKREKEDGERAEEEENEKQMYV